MGFEKGEEERKMGKGCGDKVKEIRNWGLDGEGGLRGFMGKMG